MMMSIDHKKDHFKRQREEEEEAMAVSKKRKVELSEQKPSGAAPAPSHDFHKKMYASYINSALDALDSVSYSFCIHIWY